MLIYIFNLNLQDLSNLGLILIYSLFWIVETTEQLSFLIGQDTLPLNNVSLQNNMKLIVLLHYKKKKCLFEVTHANNKKL